MFKSTNIQRIKIAYGGRPPTVMIALLATSLEEVEPAQIAVVAEISVMSKDKNTAKDFLAFSSVETVCKKVRKLVVALGEQLSSLTRTFSVSRRLKTED